MLTSRTISGTGKLAIGVALCVLAALLSCSGGASSTPLEAASPTAELVLTQLASPTRLAAGSGADFAPMQDGADFADDLPCNRCAANDPMAELSPIWSESSNSSADAAYCIYRLALDPSAPDALLEFSWGEGAPDAADLWLGLADWNADNWTWQQPTPSGNATIGSPADYADADQHCLAAVVVLGSTPVDLAQIGFAAAPLPYPIVDTNQLSCNDDHGQPIDPTAGQPFYGQDAQYDGNQPSYQDNGDGTITDLVTGLMWAKTPNNFDKVTFEDAFTVADNLTLADYDDWRVPTIKELYSLIDFSGETGMDESTSTPYINTDYFDFEYGDVSAGERMIDAQYWSSTEYVSTTMNGSPTTFGVNFADGRIKGYGRIMGPPGDQTEMQQFIRCVRGNPSYGSNSFSDNGDGTISDAATGLMWMQVDSGSLAAGPNSDGKLNWQQALDWAENLEYAGYSDWRLPNSKELQSIVDYLRSPDTTNSAAIDPLFTCTPITDEGGSTDYAAYWSSTSHKDGPIETRGDYACYVCFGEGQGWMEAPPDSGNYEFWDVHGAGCQRSDPKDGDPADYPLGHGPQGDVIRIFNMVRCVRDIQ